MLERLALAAYAALMFAGAGLVWWAIPHLNPPIGHETGTLVMCHALALFAGAQGLVSALFALGHHKGA